MLSGRRLTINGPRADPTLHLPYKVRLESCLKCHTATVHVPSRHPPSSPDIARSTPNREDSHRSVPCLERLTPESVADPLIGKSSRGIGPESRHHHRRSSSVLGDSSRVVGGQGSVILGVPYGHPWGFPCRTFNSGRMTDLDIVAERMARMARTPVGPISQGASAGGGYRGDGRACDVM